MALPRIDTPTYQLTLPSTQEKIDYRPFLVKEQKIIMMAQESNQDQQSVDAVSKLVSACTFDKFDVINAPTFDVEYLFLQLRAKSVGETAKLSIKCEKCDWTKPHEHNTMWSGIVYLNDNETPLCFPELNLEVKPRKNEYFFFNGIIQHGTSPLKDGPKYAIPFNLIEVKEWDK